MSRKTDRVSSQIVRELSSVLFEDVKDEKLKKVTITAAEVTSDLGIARIYYTYMGDEDIKLELEKAAPYIRLKLAERLDIRHTPELKFIFDESIEYGSKIEKIIENINKGN